MTRRWAPICAAMAVLGIGRAAAASDCDVPDPSWLLCEDFEGGVAGWDRWYAQSSWAECDGCPDGTNDPDRIRLEQDAALAHDGELSLHMPGTSDAFLGGTLRFATCAGDSQAGCTLEGHDRLYFRTWVRLAADHDYVHHFLGIGGSRPDAYWDANGNAGCRPNGERWAGTRVDLNEAHELFFYTYFPGMSCDSGGYCSGSYAEDICAGCANIDMPCEGGLECCWGNHFEPEQPVVVPTEAWTCIEMMMELNTPGMDDGAMAFWVNDALAHEVTGMAWRDVADLQLNRAMLEHYIASGDTDHPNAVWFDDVVVSTQPIGCSGIGGGSEGGEEDTGAPADGGSSPPPGDDGPAASDDGSNADGTGAADDGDGTAASSIGSGQGSGGTGDGSQRDDTDASGCACRATDRSPPPAWLSVALGLLLLGARRRRAAVLLAASSSLLACGGDDGAGPMSPAADTGLASTGEPSDDSGDDSGDDSATNAAAATSTSGGSTSDADDTQAASGDGSDTGEGTTEPGCVPWDPWFYDGFETYRPGQSLSGNAPFDAAGRTSATDEVALAGDRAARMQILPEDDGGFGEWGGIVPLPDLEAGRSVWVRLWVRWPAEFEFSASPWMKFLRLHNQTAEGENGGYNDLYVDNADSETSVLRVIKEIHDVWEVYDGPALPRDTWERYEMQLVIDHVPVADGGQARFRVWRDDALIFDRTDVPTITAPGGTIDALYIFTYWNNEMPPDNVAFIDELTITFDDDPPPETDEHGNARIGGWLPCDR